MESSYIRPLWRRDGKISNMMCRILVLEIYRLALVCSLQVANEKLEITYLRRMMSSSNTFYRYFSLLENRGCKFR